MNRAGIAVATVVLCWGICIEHGIGPALIVCGLVFLCAELSMALLAYLMSQK